MSMIKVAVITGGHPFDVEPFHQLFNALPVSKLISNTPTNLPVNQRQSVTVMMP